MVTIKTQGRIFHDTKEFFRTDYSEKGAYLFLNKKWALVEDLGFVKKMFIVLKSLTPKDSDGYKILLEWQKQVKKLFGDE